MLVFLGQRFLKKQFTVSESRDKLFILGTTTVMSSLSFAGLISFITRNKVYSIYQLIGNDYHWTTSLLSSLLHLTVEVIVAVDLIVHGAIIVFTIYLYSFGMRFWLQKIWYVCVLYAMQSLGWSIHLCFKLLFLINDQRL